MKVIIYTLTAEGKVPSYVKDGGYFPKANNQDSPQDWDFVGVADDNATEAVLNSRAEILAYCETFMTTALIDKEANTVTVAEAVNEWCNEKGVE